ncbi:MAG: iron export ABC transporter permease subunit FetB [Proteobacteria bacterium]|nr:MAG: iron export ABC transporter permease subunit FetB [Pseudomonadota bacterium]QKK10655.1 MAG: iron export ABC transporter permease subunit FetB [Pseudomonadota bacterium]
MILLDTWDLLIAAALMLILAALAIYMHLGIAHQVFVAGVRCAAQLLLVGLVLKTLFEHVNLLWVVGLSFLMLLLASREIHARQRHRLAGWWSFGVGGISMFISSFAVAVLALTVIVGADPWYHPQYAIPLLGMLLGNTMNGVAIGLDRLTSGAHERRRVIEARLILGHTWREAISDVLRDAIRSGTIPIVNAMAAAGIVSLPGMMTGQILAGSPPVEAVKYQIMILFLVSAGTGFGTIAAVWIAARRLFDERQRLRLDHLKDQEKST